MFQLLVMNKLGQNLEAMNSPKKNQKIEFYDSYDKPDLMIETPEKQRT
jgi:hypothetical protein